MAWSGGFDDQFEELGSFVTTDVNSRSTGARGGQRNQRSSSMINQNNYGTGSEGETTIASLSPNVPGSKLIGVIIAKEDPRGVSLKKDPGKQRHVVSLTLRDTPDDSINLSCWGEEEYIQELARKFHIGDVVEINQYIVQMRRMDGTDERFRPATSSMYQLNLSENRSSIELHCGLNMGGYNQLTHVPAKASNDYYTIGDILSNGQLLQGETINLQAAIKNVGAVKNIITKTGKQIKRCEVKLFDETAPNFTLILWNEEIISVAQTWVPKDNVIFAADVRITYDDFKKTMIATANSRTIVTANPDTREAHSLFTYAQTVELDDPRDSTGENMSVDLESIKTVCTVKQVKEKTGMSPDADIDYAILYAYISKFNIDDGAPVSGARCVKCRRRVDNDTLMCANSNCPQGALINQGDYGAKMETENQYNITVSLSDRTGSISPCYLAPEAAEQMLGSTVDEFIASDEEKKTMLKWNFLLEKCKVYVKITLPSYKRSQLTVRVLGCTRTDPKEAVKFL